MESSTTPPPSHHHSNSQGQDGRHPRVANITKHVKRASMPSISAAGNNAKTLLQSKFGEAFRRFEHQEPTVASSSPPQSPPSSSESVTSPINLAVYDEDADWESLSPEVRREIEQQRLAMEDRRVRQAADEYKRNVGSGAPLRNQKTATILSPTVTARPSALIENQRTPGPIPTQPSLLIAQQIAQYEQQSILPESPSTAKPPLPPKPNKLRTVRGEAGRLTVDSEPNLLGDSTEWDTKDFEKRYP